MWPDLPFEFVVVGTPVSLQSANRRARDGWKATVLNAAEKEVGEGSWAFEDCRLSVTLFYFPQVAMEGDIDNIVKLTLDALIPRIYLDDSLVDRVLVQRFSPETLVTFREPSEKLLDALAMREPALFIKLDHQRLDEVST